MENIKNIIPIILITIIVLYTDKIQQFTNTILGKVSAIVVISCLTYFIDIRYSIFAIIVILYYLSLDNHEGFNNAKQLFREQNCKNGLLTHKNQPVKTEMAQHVFPELNFKGKSCDPCSQTCDFDILEEKLKNEELLIAPKNSNDWVSEIFATKPNVASNPVGASDIRTESFAKIM
jgi:hypothetical protein